LIQPVTAGGSKTFPVGRTTGYFPVVFTLAPGSTSDNFSVRLLPGVYAQGVSGNAFATGAVNNTWVIGEAVAGGTTASVQLQWPGAAELPSFNRNATRLARHDGTAWDFGQTNIAANGSNPYNASRSSFTSMGAFAVMEQMQVLPVSWLSFSGKREGVNNHLKWSTATETSNSHFIVEGSADGITFSERGKVNAAGTTSEIRQYEFIDRNGATALMYYRIRQVDADGKFTYSKVIAMPAGEMNQLSVQVFAAGTRVDLFINSSSEGAAGLRVYDAAGRNLLSSQLTILSGINKHSVDMPNLTPGVYLLHLQTSKEVKVIKFVR
jgi:hypothetical protein